MVEIRDTDNIWRCDILKFNAPLEVGVTLVIHPKLMEMTNPAAARPTEDVKWRIVAWNYLLLDVNSDHIEVVVEEIPAPWRSPFKNPEHRFQVAVFCGVFTAVALIGTLYYLSSLAPDDRWAIIGRHARTWGGWTLFLVFSIILPSRLGLSKKSSFWSTYVTELFVMAGFVMVAAWLSISKLPDHFSGASQEYAAYARALFARLKTDNWPLMLAALPWAAVAFKVLGFDSAEKASDALVRAAKD